MQPVTVDHLILHPGTAKTGTTSLQNFLFSRQKDLLKRGFVYPTSGTPLTDDTAKGHHRLAFAVAEQSPEADRELSEIAEGLRAEMAAAPGATLILSSEVLFSRARLDRFRSIIQTPRCTVHVAVRQQHDSLNARYYTAVSHNRYKGSIDEFLKKAGRGKGYLQRLLEFEELAPKTEIRLRIFERGHPARDNPVRDFLDTAGIDLPEDSVRNVVEHPTLPAQATLLLRLINEMDCPPDVYYNIFSNLHKLRKIFDPEVLVIAPEQIVELVDRYAAENAELRKRYGDGQVGDLFGSPRIPDAEVWNRVIGKDPRQVEINALTRLLDCAGQ